MNFLRCPACNELFDPESTPAMPFCSDRCRQVDLGRWLDERYSVPVERNPDELEEDFENGMFDDPAADGRDC